MVKKPQAKINKDAIFQSSNACSRTDPEHKKVNVAVQDAGGENFGNTAAVVGLLALDKVFEGLDAVLELDA